MTETSDGDAHILTSEAVMCSLNNRIFWTQRELSLVNIWGSALKSHQICF